MVSGESPEFEFYGRLNRQPFERGELRREVTQIDALRPLEITEEFIATEEGRTVRAKEL